MIVFLYLISSTSTDKKFVGQTDRSIELRYTEHLDDYREYLNKLLAGDPNPPACCRALCRGLHEHNIDTFSYRLLDIASSQVEADEMERRYIVMYNSLSPNGFNLTTGGKVGFKMSDETRKLLHDAHIGKPDVPVGDINDRLEEIRAMKLPLYTHRTDWNGVEKFIVKYHPLCTAKQFRSDVYGGSEHAKWACILFVRGLEASGVPHRPPPKAGGKLLPKGVIKHQGGYKVQMKHNDIRIQRYFNLPNKTDEENLQAALECRKKFLET